MEFIALIPFALISLILFIIWFIQMCMIVSRLGKAKDYQKDMLAELRKMTAKLSPPVVTPQYEPRLWGGPR